jgi:hypothetical protein
LIDDEKERPEMYTPPIISQLEEIEAQSNAP